MQWYIPITIIPGIGLIVLSTSNLLIALNSEISSLNKEKEKYHQIIALKIAQLKRLNWAMVLQYTGILLFLVSGILAALTDPMAVYVNISMITGVVVFLVAIAYLISYGFRSINIRQRHLNL